MCKHGTDDVIAVRVPADLASGGRAFIKFTKVDACIAPIVRALQHANINMRGCCCGHGKGTGSIALQDGRTLAVTKRKEVFNGQ